jgi:two-component system NtrC family response regulator
MKNINLFRVHVNSGQFLENAVKKDRLLIIEDDSSIARQLKWSLCETYNLSFADDSKTARKLLGSGTFPVATLDLGIPPHPDTSEEGLKILEDLPTLAPHTKVVVITGNTEQQTAIQAVKLGAADYCEKPIDLDVLHIILNRTFKMQSLEAANRELLNQTEQSGSFCGILSVSPVMQNLFKMIRKVSISDYPILISGESGTGKEMVAKAVHQLSPRAKKPMVIINCGAIPENLMESELFGHEKGAFTGAVDRKPGKFEHADLGTVFLDEIGELPLAMQVKLLRFLQEGTIERIGGKSPISLDIRIIAATNTDLEKAIKQGNFREDLYFRLNVVPIKLPALKDRPEDIMLLAQHFLQTESRSLKTGRVSFSSDAIAALMAHTWTGNVRELQNRIRRAIATVSGKWITADDLELEICGSEKAGETFYTLQEARSRAEQSCVLQALAITGNNITLAAKLLQTTRPTVYDLMKKHGITV